MVLLQRSFPLLLLLCMASRVVLCFQQPFHVLHHDALTKRIAPTQRPRPLINIIARPFSQILQRSATSNDSATTTLEPQVVAAGTSTKTDLLAAIQEAVTQAASQFPNNNDNDNIIDVAIVYVSSLYEASKTGIVTVPAVLAAGQANGRQIRTVIGASCAAVVDTSRDLDAVPAVSVTLLRLPETSIRPFYIAPNELPDDAMDNQASSVEIWKRIAGLSHVTDDDAPVFWLLPSPAFSTQLDGLLQGLYNYFPGSTIVGAIASTVSSLSRAQLYSYGGADSGTTCHTDGGCVGLVITGDIRMDSLTARGAKAVGGIYNVLQAKESTIQTIVLDEAATEALKEDEAGDDEEEETDEEDEPAPEDSKQAMAQFYAKAKMPKPVLAEANFLMKTLSDDDQAFMRRQLLVGLEQGGAVGRSASELVRLSKGEGYRFTIYQVASAGMKDGSVHLPLGSVQVSPGTRMRFFVREPDFAAREIDAIWTGYKQRQLNEQFSDDQTPFTPAGCFLVPTLDRGNKFFVGKPNFETRTAADYLPTVPSISGFYANGIINRMDGTMEKGTRAGVQGSASGYFLLGSVSGRPVYSATAAQQEAADEEDAISREEVPQRPTKGAAVPSERAPRSENGELVLKRREVHSGRALTVSTVEWSVAEKTANPSSALEGFMWDKETEVDRFRERVPLANLVSQCRLSTADPTKPKPRDWVGPILQSESDFIIIPECKRTDPASGSLRKRYDIKKLAREFTLAGAPALSVNCDAILFGGSMEHITETRAVSSQAALEKPSSEDGVIAPPILASDLILYPYQLYKMQLAGADAVNLMVGALESKDLKYLSKIAASLKLQTLAMVTSVTQLERLDVVDDLNGIIVSNRELEDFSFDETGDQALQLLQSDALKALKAKHDDKLLVFAEGRIGLIETSGEDGSKNAQNYLVSLKDAGAMGAIVGGGLSIGAANGVALEEMQSIVS